MPLSDYDLMDCFDDGSLASKDTTQMNDQIEIYKHVLEGELELKSVKSIEVEEAQRAEEVHKKHLT